MNFNSDRTTALHATTIAAQRAEAIALLNDDLRKHPHGVGKRAVVTRALNARGPAFAIAAMRAVAAFTAFGPHNDPHGERDFGRLVVGGHEVLFKIDTYDADGVYASEDPSDPAQTLRVLTLMLPEDY